MIIQNIELAKKYAVAFLNIYEQTITYQDYQSFIQAEHFLKHHRKALFLFNIPLIKQSIKKNVLDEWRKKYILPESFNKLIDLLLMHQRLWLLPDIVQCLVQEYRFRNNILFFTISSSYQLEPSELEVLRDYLAQKTGKSIDYVHTITPDTLIAGIRMQSSSYVWERSVGKQLKLMRRSLV